jgi:molybdate transport system substrate-binding protein
MKPTPSKRWKTVPSLALLLAAFGAASPGLAASVGAAASLSTVLREAAGAFAARRGEAAPSLHFAASGEILSQLRHGAPLDAVLFADRETADAALAEDLIDGEFRVVARNRIVLAVSPPLASSVRTVADLARPEVERIAVGNPKYVPAGRYAREILKREGVLERVSERFVTAGSATQAVRILESGEADAALLFATDAAHLLSKGFAVLPVEGSRPTPYPAALVAGAERRAEAAAFLDFLASPEGAALFRRFGFAAASEAGGGAP